MLSNTTPKKPSPRLPHHLQLNYTPTSRPTTTARLAAFAEVAGTGGGGGQEAQKADKEGFGEYCPRTLYS